MPREDGGLMADGKQIASTLQCPHCGGHFVSIAGSGIRRTYCVRCKKVTCGQFSCDECIPFEAKLEFIEGGTSSYKNTIEELISRGGIIL